MKRPDRKEPPRPQSVLDRIIETVAAYDRRDCCIEGCDAPRRYRQYCANHYAALKRAGTHPKNEPRIRVNDGMYALIEASKFKGEECLRWTRKFDCGYPYLSFKAKVIRAHVAICEHVHGQKPSEKYEAAHQCGNSWCVNPRHLSWKTHKDNIADKRRHNTLPLGEKHPQARLTLKQVQEIRSLRGERTRMQMAADFGVGLSTVDNVLDGKTWSSFL